MRLAKAQSAKADKQTNAVMRHDLKTPVIASSFFCPSPAWWLLQGGQTRSHPELGRQTPQRQWYYVSRPGRVGRRQACEGRNSPIRKRYMRGGFAGRRLHLAAVALTSAHGSTVDAGWSSPVARQAHNLKVTGSNPVPATKLESPPAKAGGLFCIRGTYRRHFRRGSLTRT